MLLLAPFAIGYLLWCEYQGIGTLGHAGGVVDTLMLLSGVITAVPLVMLACGARRIPRATNATT